MDQLALVGRQEQLDRLLKTINGLDEGRGGVVFVLGEAGIGKSRLVEEARALNAGGRIRWLEGRSLSYGGSLSYWAVTQMMLSDLGLSDGDPVPKMRVALRQRAGRLFGDGGASVLPYLEQLLGMRFEDDSQNLLAGLDSETLRHQTLSAVWAYFKAAAELEPIVLLFEDLHWADPSSLAVLEKLFELTDRAPLLLMCLMRADREHKSWNLKFLAQSDYAHRFTEIQLEPLTEEMSNQLVGNLLAEAELPADVRSLLLERSDGNPFYLEEVIRSLIDRGALAEEGGRWTAAREIHMTEIPDTLQGVLLARIDRLEEDVRRTLQLASVIGRSFLYRLLEAISEAERELDFHLTQLQRLDLVREKERYPELEYIFKHSLTQEAAYSSILMDRRRDFHRKIALALESLFEDRQDEYLGLLAYHFDQGGDSEKAVPYLIRAGDRARLGDAQQEAAQFYERAVELLEKRGSYELAAETYLKLGMVYHVDFRFADAHRANEAAFRLQREHRETNEGPISDLPEQDADLKFVGGLSSLDVTTLDPGNLTQGDEGVVIQDLFAGIAELQPDLNVIPRGASSWEVFDEGLRYVIHLRDDVYWTNGTPVTAADYEWAWKRNLRLSDRDYPASMLDDIEGARDFRLKVTDDLGAVGVRALDQWTLEVRLEKAVAYFPYLLAMPITFPQPRQVVERVGGDWWLPENLVGNGPYRLLEFEPGKKAAYERNPGYSGALPKAAPTQVEWLTIGDDQEREALFRQGRLDYGDFIRHRIQDTNLFAQEIPDPGYLHLSFLVFAPVYPLDDIRVRQALIYAIDPKYMNQARSGFGARGGVVPPGMAGHSPGISLPYDPTLARRLLHEAGYPEGEDFPRISGRMFLSEDAGTRISTCWREVLGIDIDFNPGTSYEWDLAIDLIYCHGWFADYPDPDNFLRQISIFDFLRSHGWQDTYFDDLVSQAAETPDRAKRMAMYRKADRYITAELALVKPLGYGLRARVFLQQPWVQDMRFSPLGFLGARYITIDPQTRSS